MDIVLKLSDSRLQPHRCRSQSPLRLKPRSNVAVNLALSVALGGLSSAHRAASSIVCCFDIKSRAGPSPRSDALTGNQRLKGSRSTFIFRLISGLAIYGVHAVKTACPILCHAALQNAKSRESGTSRLRATSLEGRHGATPGCNSPKPHRVKHHDVPRFFGPASCERAPKNS